MREPETLLQRRSLLTGQFPQRTDRFLHISSAVVTARPEQAAGIAARLARLPGTEVHAVEGAKIILVLEGPSAGEIGTRLNDISGMEGVFSAALVYEQILPLDERGDLA